MTVRRALVCGAGGFIGSHLVKRLKREGFRVRGVDVKRPEFAPTEADDFVLGDLRDERVCRGAIDGPYDEVYQLAADMGGAGYVFTGENDAAIMHNSAMITLNVLEACRTARVGRIFYSSSACIYPQENQTNAEDPITAEASAYPAHPDSDYGWEKLFGERLFAAYARNYGMQVRVARFHNVFGEEGTWAGGREKAPAAVCRKVAMEADGGEIDLWGDGEQTRSFLYIDECLEGVRRLMASDFEEPVNIGSAEMVSINELARLVMRIAGKRLRLRHIPGPLGVRGRKSDNCLIAARLGWAPSQPLVVGLERTYRWIDAQVRQSRPTRDATEPLVPA